MRLPAACIAMAAALVACGTGPRSEPDGGFIPYGDAAQPTVDGATDAGLDAPAFYLLPDGGHVAADRFVTSVVSFDAGPCSGFGQSSMPGIVEGPPVGGGCCQGSTDVVSLGNGGSIVVSFAPNAIVDGPGPDFIVFENPFEIADNPNNLYAEPGIVSVSDDGVSWTSFPCTATFGDPPYGLCAGVHPVYSAPGNGISPVDPSVSGGDAFDLADIGVTHARYVRIVDHTVTEPCDATHQGTMNGFDLDAVSIVNAEMP